jgi:hypothetical protein
MSSNNFNQTNPVSGFCGSPMTPQERDAHLRSLKAVLDGAFLPPSQSQQKPSPRQPQHDLPRPKQQAQGHRIERPVEVLRLRAFGFVLLVLRLSWSASVERIGDARQVQTGTPTHSGKNN